MVELLAEGLASLSAALRAAALSVTPTLLLPEKHRAEVSHSFQRLGFLHLTHPELKFSKIFRNVEALLGEQMLCSPHSPMFLIPCY